MAARLRIVSVSAALLVVLFGAQAGAHVRPTLGLLPDGDTRPVVHSAILQAPHALDPLLEARVDIDASDNDAIARYEYRWIGTGTGMARAMNVRQPRVSYASIRPDAPFTLEVRAVDIHNNASDWFEAWKGTTPSPPRVIVAGDSIASGYTRDWFTGDATCRSNSLSYGSTIVAEMAKVLPSAWAPTYSNIAWAGAGVGNMLAGGDDSCGETHASQVAQIGQLARSTWNIVVITAGINTTNWTDVMVDLTKDTAVSMTKDGDRKACDLALHETWDIDETGPVVARTTRKIVRELRDETNASVYWTGYHDIVGTRLAPGWSPVGTECTDELDEALNALHGAIRTGLGPEATWIDIDGSITTQDWAGWPHPDAAGHAAIGRLIAKAILES
ncbi:MAG: hypothetical protein ABFR95_01250 [Actinomycetota bacterium]